MDTDRAGDDAHDVLGGHSGPVGTQTMEALAIASQEPRIRMRSSSVVIRFVVKARARVTASGRPSTATATRVTEMIKMRVKIMPFSLGVL